MDPFSIVVGSVALVETANKVATILIDTYRDYTNAPTEMVEIADQITTCSGLVDVFANSIKGAKLPRDFHSVAQNLVDQVSLVGVTSLRNAYLQVPSARKSSENSVR